MSRRGLIAVAVTAALVMLALVLTTVAPAVPIVSRPPDPGATISRLPTTTISPARTAPSVASGSAEPGPAFSLSGPFFQIMTVLFVLLLLICGALLVQTALRRRPHLVAQPDASFDVPEIPEELLRTAKARMTLLETGTARNAIVAAWLDLEESATATGLPRHPAETSTEYTERVVGTWPVRREQLSALAALYREARFSLHALGEPERARAIAALRALHADLEQVSLARREGTPT